MLFRSRTRSLWPVAKLNDSWYQYGLWRCLTCLFIYYYNYHLWLGLLHACSTASTMRLIYTVSSTEFKGQMGVKWPPVWLYWKIRAICQPLPTYGWQCIAVVSTLWRGGTLYACSTHYITLHTSCMDRWWLVLDGWPPWRTCMRTFATFCMTIALVENRATWTIIVIIFSILLITDYLFI